MGKIHPIRSPKPWIWVPESNQLVKGWVSGLTEIWSQDQFNSITILSAKGCNRFETKHEFECCVSYFLAPNLKTFQISEFEILVNWKKCGVKFISRINLARYFLFSCLCASSCMRTVPLWSLPYSCYGGHICDAIRPSGPQSDWKLQDILQNSLHFQSLPGKYDK